MGKLLLFGDFKTLAKKLAVKRRPLKLVNPLNLATFSRALGRFLFLVAIHNYILAIAHRGWSQLMLAMKLLMILQPIANICQSAGLLTK